MRLLLLLLAASYCCMTGFGATEALPETVHFQSGDGATKLIGYLYRPEGRGPHPAIVLLHGRAGAYSSLAKGVYDAKTLSKRHKFWGEYWAERGYVTLLVDSFGPRGYWEGFPRGSYDERPSAVSEQTMRPLDAYGALAYLRSRKDVMADRVGLQGWSNGGMTTLVTMSAAAPGISAPTPSTGFRAALAFYPGRGMEAIKSKYTPYAPLHLFVGMADEEVSPKRCQRWEGEVKSRSNLIDLTAYDGAEHNFDDPSASKQRNPANEAATEDARTKAEDFFRKYLKP
jgi:carboxymethylenebutenolidase